MTSRQSSDDLPAAPRRIGCRVCMSTAELSEQFVEAEAINLSGLGIAGTLTHATYHCPEGHVTHAVFDGADGSLKIYEPDSPGLGTSSE